MSKTKNKELKEFNIPFIFTQYIIKNVMNYLLFSFYFNISYYIKKYYISNHRESTTNYKSIHFMMNNKESNEEMIQNYI